MAETLQLIIFAGAFVAAGFFIGAWRPEWIKPIWRWQGKALLVVIALVVVGFMLASLFNSAALGWIIGLGLMVLLALAPGLALFGLGQWMGAKAKRPAADASLKQPPNPDSPHS